MGIRPRRIPGRHRCRRAQTRSENRREQNKLKPTQAQTVIAAALLRQLWAVVTSGKAWDPARAANGLIGIEEAIVA